MTYNVLFVLFPGVIRNRTVEARKRAREKPSSAVFHRVAGFPVESCQDMLGQLWTAFLDMFVVKRIVLVCVIAFGHLFKVLSHRVFSDYMYSIIKLS